jgi:flagellin-like hook-associated protein FlgL
VTTAAFTIAPNTDTVTYQGDGEINQVKVGDNLEAQQNIPGDDVFKPIFDALESLLRAMDTGDTGAIGVSVKALTSTLTELNLARGQVGAELNKLQNADSQLSTDEINLHAQQSRIEDTNVAEAAVQLNQLQTALNGTLSAGQSILQQHNLFDFLA